MSKRLKESVKISNDKVRKGIVSDITSSSKKSKRPLKKRKK